MKTLIISLIIIMTVSSPAWGEPLSVSSLLRIVEEIANQRMVEAKEGDGKAPGLVGLRDISKVGITILLSDKTNLFTKQELENQLLVGLRSKIPKLEVTTRYERYTITLNIVVVESKGYVAYINLSALRFSVIPGATLQSLPIFSPVTLWEVGGLLVDGPSTAKSYLKGKIDNMITAFAADYYRQNAPQSELQKVREALPLSRKDLIKLKSFIDVALEEESSREKEWDDWKKKALELFDEAK